MRYELSEEEHMKLLEESVMDSIKTDAIPEEIIRWDGGKLNTTVEDSRLKRLVKKYEDDSKEKKGAAPAEKTVAEALEADTDEITSDDFFNEDIEDFPLNEDTSKVLQSLIEDMETAEDTLSDLDSDHDEGLESLDGDDDEEYTDMDHDDEMLDDELEDDLDREL